MARKWCGFLPQNQTIKKNWELLEARQEESPPGGGGVGETGSRRNGEEPEATPGQDEEASPPGEGVPIRTRKGS